MLIIVFVEDFNVINVPKCSKVLNVITFGPKCNKPLNLVLTLYYCCFNYGVNTSLKTRDLLHHL